MVCGLVAAVPLAVVAWLLVWWLDPNLRRGRAFEAELSDREPVLDAELTARYFAAEDMPDDLPVEVRRVFARHTDYPADRLLPDDDLTFFWAELDMVELIRDLEAGFGIAITDAEVERTPCTIRAVSRLVAGKARRIRRCP